MVETESIAEEEGPLNTARGSIRQTEPSRSRRQQSENSIELSESSHSGGQSPNHSPLSNSSTPDGNEVSDPYGNVYSPREREAITLYNLRIKKLDLIYGKDFFYK